MSVCKGDNIKLAFNFFNLQGLIDLNSVQWLPAIIQPLKN